MHKICIEDNLQIPNEKVSLIPKLSNKLIDKTLEYLQNNGVFVFPSVLNETDDLSKKQKIIRKENDALYATNVMGFIGFGDERLVIRSRFSDQNEKDYFFQYLLEKVFDVPNLVELKSDCCVEDQILNILEFIFPFYLKKALCKGIFKTYLREDFNDSSVKGYIDVARHISKNTPFIGKIAYSLRKYSYDNFLMELIRHTIEYIKCKKYGGIILSKVREEVRRVLEVTTSYDINDRQKVVYKNRARTVRHAYYHEYRELQSLCIMILSHRKQQIGSGSKEIYGLLFDGAWLWEEYMYLMLKDQFYHPRNKGKTSGAQRLFYNVTENSREGLIYPDFISKFQKEDRNDSFRIIADAKYKPLDNVGNGNNDFFQILAYMFRFDSKKAFYFYPEKMDSEIWAIK